MRWGVFKQKRFCLRITYFFHVLLDCNLFEINVSYGFGNIKAINLLRQQPSAQLIITLRLRVLFMDKISMTQTCLYNISYQKATGFFTTSRYRRNLAIVWHNTNFATAHSRVTVGSCSVEYKYKLLHQFTTMVGGIRY